jgi:hypothetical protein
MRSVKPNGFAEMERSLEKDIASNLQEVSRANNAFRQIENGKRLAAVNSAR